MPNITRISRVYIKHVLRPKYMRRVCFSRKYIRFLEKRYRKINSAGIRKSANYNAEIIIIYSILHAFRFKIIENVFVLPNV